MLWKENIREFMKRIRQRPVRSGGSGGSGQTDRTMWVVRSDEDGDGRMKMGMNPDRATVSSALLTPSQHHHSSACAVRVWDAVGEDQALKGEHRVQSHWWQGVSAAMA